MPMVRSGNADIYYEVRGANGPPVVMIRGFASSIDSWNRVDEDLARDHTAVVLDNRGIGRSSTPSGTYTVARMADDVVRVMDAAGLHMAHVLGTSLGGMIAQELALRHSRRILSLVLAGTTCGRSLGLPLRRRGVLAVALAGLMPPRLRAHVSSFATLSAEARRCRPELIERRAELLAGCRPSLLGLVGQAFAVFTHRTADRLASIRVPTLVIHGDADELIDCRNAEVLGGLIGSSRVELWPGVGHDMATEVPHRLAHSVRQHVRDAVARPNRYLRIHPGTTTSRKAHGDVTWTMPPLPRVDPAGWAEPA